MARVRSPAYPFLSLTAAMDMTRKVYSKQQKTAEPRSVVMRHMGYSSENGRALKAISALIKYGFLETVGDEGLRVSDRAMSIMYPENDRDREEALRAAANEPALFQEIFRRWENKRPSPESLESYLNRRGFNMNSVDQVARAFYETFDLVSGGTDSYDSAAPYGPDDAEEEDDAMPEQQEPKSSGKVTWITKAQMAAKAAQVAATRNDTKPIFDFETVQVNTTIDNRDDLGELIARLEQLRPMLPPKVQH
ncbi:hypothetical protein [Mesorhizobium sp.]|uniref:hypothetical protein n=1 Tax=Mesorhizobium sp. TaxID=1871066 RepID=UPI000FE4C391|nr:hypothetical protein [Mesorhizobium sp.]RWA61250.1 MAG: hypothetical protein EOQ27_18300 [Mesorhizobium sp.]